MPRRQKIGSLLRLIYGNGWWRVCGGQMASIDLTPGPACRVIILLPTIGQKAKATDLSSPLVGNPDFGAMSNLAANIKRNPERREKWQ